MNDDIEVVTSLESGSVSLYCPHCGARESGFDFDPRGTIEECDSCGKSYKIHEDADIEMY